MLSGSSFRNILECHLAQVGDGALVGSPAHLVPIPGLCLLQQGKRREARARGILAQVPGIFVPWGHGGKAARNTWLQVCYGQLAHILYCIVRLDTGTLSCATKLLGCSGMLRVEVRSNKWAGHWCSFVVAVSSCLLLCCVTHGYLWA